MNIEERSAEHLGEEELVGLLDLERAAAETRGWTMHLQECVACSDRLRELQDTSQWLHEHVGALDERLPLNDLDRAGAWAAIGSRTSATHRTRYGTGRLRVAAMIAFVLVTGFSVRPLRAWISDHVGRLAGTFETTAPLELPGSSAGAPGALVTFTPSRPVFRVELGSRQASGSLTIEVAEVGQASAQVIGGTTETLGVQPEGVWIENEPRSAASYHVRLPSRLIETVDVVAEGALISRHSAGEITEPLIVNLATGRGVQ